jgi:hypothetical protein
LIDVFEKVRHALLQHARPFLVDLGLLLAAVFVGLVVVELVKHVCMEALSI